MSWDVILMKIPETIHSASDLPVSFHHELGLRTDIVKQLKETVPELSIPSEDFGLANSEEYSIEFYIGNNEIVDTIMMSVRGSESAIRVIENICQKTGWRALDTTTGGFINFENNPAEGFKQWKTSRDSVVDHLKAAGENVIIEPRAFVINKSKRWWEFWK